MITYSAFLSDIVKCDPSERLFSLNFGAFSDPVSEWMGFDWQVGTADRLTDSIGLKIYPSSVQNTPARDFPGN